MPVPNPSHAAASTEFPPAAVAAGLVDALVADLVRRGFADRTEVRLLAALHRAAVTCPGWHDSVDFLATLQSALDGIFDVVMNACPEWHEGNANDLHVRAYAVVTLLLAMQHALIERGDPRSAHRTAQHV